MKRIVGVSLCVALLLVMGQSGLAAELHEDPEAAEPVYSGIALLDYYSTSLDFILQKNLVEVEAWLEKVPFAYIPGSLEVASEDFASSGIAISHLLVGIDEGWNQRQELVSQSRFSEAEEVIDAALALVARAYTELDRLSQAVETTGGELGVGSAQASANLKEAYARVLDRIERIRAMLALYEELLSEWPEGLEERLQPTDVTLQVEPAVAYVGDSIQCRGWLTTQGEGLGGREVAILLDGAPYITVVTDAYGYYSGTMSLPYRYAPESNVQALYYPREEDVGLYLASLSPVIKMRVLFYEASLGVEVADKAYPGRAAAVSGRFDYGASPRLEERKIEILFDDTVVFRGTVGLAFAQELLVAAETEVGQHIITVSAAANGRYAPAVASVMLNVDRAVPVLDMSLPTLTLVPGSLDVGGRLHSEVGPLDAAGIELELGRSRLATTSSADGTFDTAMKLGMGFGVIGSQDLVVRVSPREPWHTPLVASRPLLMVNIVTAGIILAVLAAIGTYLPTVLRRRLGVLVRRQARPAATVAATQPAAVNRDSSAVPVPVVESAIEKVEVGSGERHRIIGWYRRVVRLILKVTRTVFPPQQTLREFAREQSGRLGFAARYFVELTGIVERLLYSRYEPTEEDESRSHTLSHNIEEELEGEGI